MSLFEQWQNLIDNQNDETFETFWEKYSSTEKRIYSGILDQPKKGDPEHLRNSQKNMKQTQLFLWVS